jgi:hypothetical protein
LRGKAAAPSKRLTARVLIVGERIGAAGFERPDTICPLQLAFRVGEQYDEEERSERQSAPFKPPERPPGGIWRKLIL